MSHTQTAGEPRAAEVLLVEDNENDVILTHKGFEAAGLAVNIHHVEHGEDCLDFLYQRGEFDAAPAPDLILLDLNLPKMNGREVLQEIVKDDGLCHIPVVVLTTSASESDIAETYRLRCSSYITKPIDFSEFKRTVEEVGRYWFTAVTLPPHTDAVTHAEAPARD